MSILSNTLSLSVARSHRKIMTEADNEWLEAASNWKCVQEVLSSRSRGSSLDNKCLIKKVQSNGILNCCTSICRAISRLKISLKRPFALQLTPQNFCAKNFSLKYTLNHKLLEINKLQLTKRTSDSVTQELEARELKASQKNLSKQFRPLRTI